MELGFVDDGNRYDGIRPFPHAHLICTKCRKIIDPNITALSKLPKELTEKTGYRILNHRLNFFGICPRCGRAERHSLKIERSLLRSIRTGLGLSFSGSFYDAAVGYGNIGILRP